MGIEIAAWTDRAMHGRFVLLYAPRRYGRISLIHRIRRDAHDSNHLVSSRGLLGFEQWTTCHTESARRFSPCQLARLRQRVVDSPDGVPRCRRNWRRPGIDWTKARRKEAPHLREDCSRLPDEVADDLDCRASLSWTESSRGRCFER